MANALARAVGRPSKLDAPRQRILAEASRLFSRGGYEATSLQDVAAAVGITKAAVYHYFSTKQEMYETIVADLLARLEAHVLGRIGVSEGRERLRGIMLAHAEFFEANYDAFVTLLHGLGGLSRTITEREALVRDRYERLIRTTLEDGRDAGTMQVEDVQASAIAVLSMLNWMSRWYRPSGPRRATEFAESFFRVIDRGLSPR